MEAHKLRRDAANHAKPLRFAGFIIRSQPVPQDVHRAAENVVTSFDKATGL
jgi:hypothetical protein